MVQHVTTASPRARNGSRWHRRAPLLLLALLSLGFFVAACGGDDDDSPLAIEGTSWRVLTLGADTPTAPGAGAFITFDDAGAVAGTTGCNGFNGPYTTDGSDISIGPLAATAALCASDEVNDQERTFLDALDSATSYEVSDNVLTLRDDSDATLVTLEPFEPTVAGSWEVLSYNDGGQAIVSVLSGSTLTAVFGEDESLEGSGGCNTYSGNYEVGGDEIEIGGLAFTEIACDSPEGVMEQESKFLEALQSAQTWSVRGDTLEFRNRDDQIAVTLQPAS